MASLPVRGAAVRRLGLPLPLERMPPLRRGRPLKRCRYVGVVGPELKLCVGDARVAGIPQRWWAVAEPDGALHSRGAGADARHRVASRAHARDLATCYRTTRKPTRATFERLPVASVARTLAR